MITKEEREYLISSMTDLLSEYGYKYTEEALNKIIDRWVEQKTPLIEGFKTHPNYVPGKFMIASKQKYKRIENASASHKFGRWLMNYPVQEYRDIPADIKERTECGDYIPMDLWHFFRHLIDYATQFITEETAAKINEMIPALRVRAGQKTNKVVNKMCKYLGYDKHPDYNKEYAKYSDSLNPITFERNTILSINPLDYLTMSFGNSWASCHTIDKNNKRGMPNDYSGCYSSGTMSYMLDGVSMVFYTVDNSYDGTEYWNQPKINRQMYHYGEEKLIQGRLYPQDNDDCSSEYTAYRNIAQSIVSTAFNFPNLWTLKTGTDKIRPFVDSLGTHYRDYTHYDNCSISRIKGSENENHITIGAKPVCVRCGEEHAYTEIIDCCIYKRCEKCGCIEHEKDIVEIDGKFYCKSCARKCSICGEWNVRDNMVSVNWQGYVCHDCFNEHYIRCDYCHRYLKKENAIEVDGKWYHKHCVHECPICGKYHFDGAWVNKTVYVCTDCLNEHCVLCECCGNYEMKEKTVEIDGEYYCINCVHYCNLCNKWHIGNSTRIRAEGINICDNCRDKYFTYCYGCGKYVRNNDAHTKNGRTYCTNCFERSDNQTTYTFKSNRYNDEYMDHIYRIIDRNKYNNYYSRPFEDDNWI